MQLDTLENAHKGETVWVLGSGPSLNFIDPSFFDNKLCVVANHIGEVLGLKSFYLYSNYHAVHLISNKECVAGVTLLKDTLTQQVWSGDIPDNLVFSEATSYAPPGSSWNPYRMPPPEGQIVYGSSSIHGAMHLAVHLGARDVILVGADAGWIDGVSNVDGYNSVTQTYSFKVWNEHSIILKQWLAEKYGARVHSLNPFINLNLEGHRFEGV
jgi:hypothetical protein